MQKSDNVEEFKFLTTYKSRSGLIFMLSAIGIILVVISLFIPVCSYNPTALDEFKRNVGFMDLPFYWLVSLLFVILSTAAAVPVIFTLARSDWREKKKRLIIYPVLSIIAVTCAVTVLAVACVFYKIPETEFYNLETEMEAGYYLFSMGGGIFAAMFLWYCLELKKLADGKITLESIALTKKNG